MRYRWASVSPFTGIIYGIDNDSPKQATDGNKGLAGAEGEKSPLTTSDSDVAMVKVYKPAVKTVDTRLLMLSEMGVRSFN